MLGRDKHPEASTSARSTHGTASAAAPRVCQRLCHPQGPEVSRFLRASGKCPAKDTATDTARASVRLNNIALLLGNHKLAATENSLFNSRINKTLLIMPCWLQHVTLSSPYHSFAAHTTSCNFNGVTLTKVIITHYGAAFLCQKRSKHTITQPINRRRPYYCTSAHVYIKPLITVANRL